MRSVRLRRLELIRYGRFTDQVLSFPRTDRDFHVIVGPNEAGKSTIRRAISELLFGMPHRSEMDFVHPLSELRLGAVIEWEAGTFAFHRARGRKPLRSPDDDVLAETALAGHLGTVGGELFDRMFCLDLAGLLEGGRTILDASDDVGRLLFQSASGISSLGAVCDELAAEADGLYAPRKSGDRAFYQALDQYEAAREALRDATVETESWSAATGRVASIREAAREAATHYEGLFVTRQKLERMRRVAPRVAQWRETQAELQALPAAVEFPADAAKRLGEGERVLTEQTAALKLLRDNVASLREKLDALVLDHDILAIAPKVERLAEQAGACRNHPRDIARGLEEVHALLREMGANATQIGWPSDEDALRAMLPSSLALKTLASIARERGERVQALASARENRDRARAALTRLESALASPSVPAPSPDLATALEAARPFRQSGPRQRALRSAIDIARSVLDGALNTLVPWRMDPQALSALAVPGEERLSALKRDRAKLTSAVELARQQHEQAREQARRAALALEQFAAGHAVVTLDEVLQVRSARDALWRRIKAHEETLETGAPRLDAAIEQADRLVDSQRDRAADSARLTGLQQESERDAAAVEARAHDFDAARRALDEFDAAWDENARSYGLPGMALDDISAWLANRKAALDARADLERKARELASEQEAEAAAASRLRSALRASEAGVDEDADLARACDVAEKLIGDHQAARAGAEMLVRQTSEAEADLASLERRLAAASASVEEWTARWTGALRAAALDPDRISHDAAIGAIGLAEDVLDRMTRIEEIRAHRIRLMENELAGFANDARTVFDSLGLPDDGADPFDLAGTLVERLQRARDASRERDRLEAERQATGTRVRDVETSLAATRASLESLYTLADTDDHGLLRSRIAQAERRRTLEEALHRHREEIVDAGDGLTFEVLLAESDELPPETVKVRLDELDERLKSAVDRKTQLARELTEAEATVDRIRGSADAAVAESRRREALARMGDAAERYMKVATAARLLRWAIDRYRERRQGPLLQRAGTLFAHLTLGSFERLVPDFEATPPRLIAVRPGGERVTVEGLSEGTRDQLFLALRLAALELHIEADRPLPFIADDLFVNFHDSRSRAGLAVLGELSRRTQVIFLTHHEHLVEVARERVGADLNVLTLTPSRE
ncbi:MAG: AAA family ATPase [Betaproteobacteria bacterium]|nr:AAA family ATPase [Betaproteobacteria bacterium]